MSKDTAHLRPVGTEFDEISPPLKGDASAWRFVRRRYRVVGYEFCLYSEWSEAGRMLERVEVVEREELRWTDERVLQWKCDNPDDYWAFITYDETNAPEPELWRKAES